MPSLQNGHDEELSPAICGLPTDKALRQRIELLRDYFSSQFRSEPSFYLRIPGRVNLIGEHIDYCGYSVCPMALQQDILLAVKVTELHTFLSIVNQNVDKYIDFVIDSRQFTIDLAKTGWASYILCGVRGISELLKRSEQNSVSMKIAVTGNIPPSSGLSSSSALVCGGVLASALANNLELSKNELATLSATSEHYIGTVGGGMDQAIIFLGSKGCAKKIDFNPLKTHNIQLPDKAMFVVAHSLTTKDKAASADFNTRVIECRLATQVLAKINSLKWKEYFKLADFQKAVGLTLEESAVHVEETLHDEPYTKEEVCTLLGITEEELHKLSLTPNTYDVQTFKLKQRVLHVFQEALRVEKFEKGCNEGCDLSYLGQLMKDSHTSLRDLYECSSTQLDELVSAAESAGALGARLTGAGWGGCIVALTTEENVDKFISTVKELFYNGNPSVNGQDLDKLIFATQPGQGAEIFKTENAHFC